MLNPALSTLPAVTLFSNAVWAVKSVKRYHYGSHAQLKEHLQAFLNAHNFAKRLKTLKGLTPNQNIIKWWQKEPDRFKINPLRHIVELNTWTIIMNDI